MTTSRGSTVVGVFTTRANAEHALDDLHGHGFTDQQIGFIVRDTGAGEQTGTTTAGTEFTKGEGAAVGAASGGVVGGLLGAAASLLIPGFGPAIAGGILAATLGGIAIGAATGGIIGALTNAGVPEEEARYYQGEFEAGRVIVTVDAPGRQQEAIDTMRRNGAYDASTRPGTNDTATPTMAQPPKDTFLAGNQAVPGATSSATSSAHTLNPQTETAGEAYDINRGGTYPANPSTPGPDVYNPSDPHR